jgi:hypothetical protein
MRNSMHNGIHSGMHIIKQAERRKAKSGKFGTGSAQLERQSTGAPEQRKTASIEGSEYKRGVQSDSKH